MLNYQRVTIPKIHIDPAMPFVPQDAEKLRNDAPVREQELRSGGEWWDFTRKYAVSWD
jgi:hypothetical protein